jgi:hypothetical protein
LRDVRGREGQGRDEMRRRDEEEERRRNEGREGKK